MVHASTPNGNGTNGNGTGHTLPDALHVTIIAPLPELQSFITVLSNEWLPEDARVFFRRLMSAADDAQPDFAPILEPATATEI